MEGSLRCPFPKSRGERLELQRLAGWKLILQQDLNAFVSPRVGHLQELPLMSIVEQRLEIPLTLHSRPSTEPRTSRYC